MKSILTSFLCALLYAAVAHGEIPAIVKCPPIGMKNAQSHSEGNKFIRLLCKGSKLPFENDFKKNGISSYISSGVSGHSTTIYGVTYKERQNEVIRIAQALVNSKNYNWVYIEFKDREHFSEAKNGLRKREGERTLRSIVIKPK